MAHLSMGAAPTEYFSLLAPTTDVSGPQPLRKAAYGVWHISGTVVPQISHTNKLLPIPYSLSWFHVSTLLSSCRLMAEPLQRPRSCVSNFVTLSNQGRHLNAIRAGERAALRMVCSTWHKQACTSARKCTHVTRTRAHTQKTTSGGAFRNQELQIALNASAERSGRRERERERYGQRKRGAGKERTSIEISRSRGDKGVLTCSQHFLCEHQALVKRTGLVRASGTSEKNRTKQGDKESHARASMCVCVCVCVCVCDLPPSWAHVSATRILLQ